jgi:5'-nucleotidase (lipoprotein e(P4) family)
MRLYLIPICGVLACARPASTTGSVPVPASSGPATAPLPSAIVWSRASAEHRALFLQVYRAAEAAVDRQATTLPRGSWAVVLDADETVLDNSIYQQERAQLGAGFTPDSWTAWVKRGAASALPGAVPFIRKVHDAGGRVVIVTNRGEDVCTETRDNLRRVEIQADLVLCAPAGQSDKNIRFRAIEAGTASSSVPSLRVVMYVGDNIQDFPNLGQSARLGADGAFAQFGRSYFLLPNPMYGSWERNAVP